MFDIGWTELLVIAVVAIIVIGPKDLPRALRTFGRWTGKMKGMAREFQNQFNEALREAEIDSVKKQVSDLTGDPMKSIRKTLTSTESDIRKGLETPTATQVGKSPPAAPQPAAAVTEAPPAPTAEVKP
jgi:sec-independent protein translocase protein TatB